MARICCIFLALVRSVSVLAAVILFLAAWNPSDHDHWPAFAAAVWVYIAVTLAHVRMLRRTGRVRPEVQCVVRHFAAACMAWVVCLVWFPDLCGRLDAWLVTVLLVLANLLTSAATSDADVREAIAAALARVGQIAA